MRFKFLTIFAATLLLAACATPSEESGGTTGAGTTATTSTTTAPTTTISGPTPGSQEHLVVNVGDRVFFDLDKSDLSPEAQATAEALAVWMSSYPASTVGIEGHADERGTREYNLALGERRASSVQDYLVALGVSPNRLSTISYGKERPAVLGSNEGSWAQNRRGVFVVN
ncbi:MAG: peptidoglycan-associated lipoprotein Pal [Proteobacteria bacterium]|nr:peptidoglycan-associated lipoprotein Pal [Pseudomonadota bacterium]MCH8997715.1 peptidoglycan-associated lipoprotein Pal [Pseudomonadota bacterium]